MIHTNKEINKLKSHHSYGISSQFPDLPRDGPHITGEEKQYQIGDTLNINCTSGKSHPSSIIEWLINDEPVIVSFNYAFGNNDWG